MTRNLAEWVSAHLKKTNRSHRDEEFHLEISSIGQAGSDSGDLAMLGRLGDLGLSPGETIIYFGVAPLGAPIYINVRETVVALRLNEAAMINIAPVVGGGKP